jgi:serine protease Do
MDKLTKSVVAMLTIVMLFIGVQFTSDTGSDSASMFNLPEFTTTNNVESSETVEVNSLRDFNDAIVNIAESTNPTVVTITTTRTIREESRSPLSLFFDDPRFNRERERQQGGLGSGVIVSNEGYIITNNHVIDQADDIRVVFYDGDEIEAELVGADPASDIAVLKVDRNDLPAITMGDSEEMRVGEMVLAVGSPLNKQLAHTVSMGIVSATGRSGFGLNQFENFIQTDAAINPGNSGGALVNLDGELIGINTAIASRTGGNQGIGFAIPVNMARDVMEALIEDGRVARGYLGISLGAEVDQTMARALGLENPSGFVVGEVVPDGPTDNAGLQEGDVIISLNGEEFKDWTEFRIAIGTSKPGDTVELEIIRDGESRTLSVELGELDSEQLASSVTQGDRDEMAEELGFTVEELNENIRRQLDLDTSVEGVVVTNISQASGAFRQGLQRGDLITQVASTKVTTPDEFYGTIEALMNEGNEVVLLRVNRQGRNVFVAFELS